jgi:hypothetical protein
VAASSEPTPRIWVWVKVAPAGVERFPSDASCSADYAASTMLLVTTAQEKTQTIDFRMFWEPPAAISDYL